MDHLSKAINAYNSLNNELNEAKRILRESGYRVKPASKSLNEVKFSNKAHVFKEINKLSTQDQFITKMLLCMYNRQVDSEKSSRATILKNFRGFNQADASILSYLAEQYIEFHQLTPVQYDIVKEMLSKYRRQMLDIMCELNLIKIDGRDYIFDDEIYNEKEIEEKVDDIAIDMLDMVDEFNVEDFVHFAIEHAEEAAGVLDEDDRKIAAKIATDMFYTGASVHTAADRINEEI